MITKRILHIIPGQDPRARIITPLINKMHRHTPTSTAPMLQQRIGQGPDLVERETRALGKHAHAPSGDVDVAAEAEGTRDAVVLALGAGFDGHGVGLRDADYVVAGVVGCAAGFLGGVDGIAEDLDDLVVAAEGCTVTEGGAAAVDA